MLTWYHSGYLLKHKILSLTEVQKIFRNYEQDFQSKPNGFWISPWDPKKNTNGWVDWLKEQDCFNTPIDPEWGYWSGKPFSLYQITIDDTDILKINTPEKAIEFKNKYAVDNERFDWKEFVSNSGYKGILIENPNVLKDMGRDFWIYDSWKCTSCCVWDTDIVKECKRIKNFWYPNKISYDIIGFIKQCIFDIASFLFGEKGEIWCGTRGIFKG